MASRSAYTMLKVTTVAGRVVWIRPRCVVQVVQQETDTVGQYYPDQFIVVLTDGAAWTVNAATAQRVVNAVRRFERPDEEWNYR